MKRLTALGLLCAAAMFTGCHTERQGQWYRGNLHTHSLWSDGNDVPEMICDWYKKNGYQFLAISDHNVLSDLERWMNVEAIIRRGGRTAIGRYRERFGDDWVEMRDRGGKPQVRLRRLAEYRGLFETPGEFLLLQSEEISSVFQSLPIHINVTNIRQVIPPLQGTSVRDVMSRVLEVAEAQSVQTGEPMLVHLNHPNYQYAITAEDLAHVIEERFFEVWNGHPIVGHRGDDLHAGVEQVWDIANTLRIAKLKSPPLFGLGTDDSHQYFNEDPRQSIAGRGWIMVRAAGLSPKSLIAAIESGEFYASSGVSLAEVECSERAIRLAIEPAGDETFVTEFIGTLEGYDDESSPAVDEDGKPARATRRYSTGVGQVLATVHGLRPSYTLTGKELYVRAVVKSSAKPARPIFDDQVKKAWTQPVGWRQRVR